MNSPHRQTFQFNLKGNSLRRRLFGVFAVCAAMCLGFGGLAEQGTAQQQGLTLHVRLIQASNKPGPSDPRLKDVEAILRRLFRFSSYRLVAENRPALQPDNRQGIKLNNDFLVYLNLKERNGDQSTVEVELQWKKKPVIKTTARLRKGANLVLGGFPDGQDGAYMLALKPL